MLIEKKIINHIDICCFKRIYRPAFTDDDYWSLAISLMGTSTSFAQLKEMLLKQLAMARQFSTSTFRVQCKKPWEFSPPYSRTNINNLTHGSRSVKIRFFDYLQIKLMITTESLNVTVQQQDSWISVIINQYDFQELINICDYRQTDQTHGRGIAKVEERKTNGENHQLFLDFPPLGDFSGSE